MIKILHVDDDINTYEVARYGLRKVNESLHLTWCSSGKEALEVLEKDDFDCVISDYEMPEMDGLQLLHELKESQTDIPFIFLTAKNDKTSDAYEAGSADYFVKEIDSTFYERLAHSVLTHVESAKNKQQTRRAQRWLNRSSSLISAILESSISGFYATDVNGNVETSNLKFFSMINSDENRLLATLDDLFEHLNSNSNLNWSVEEYIELVANKNVDIPARIIQFNDKQVELLIRPMIAWNEVIGHLVSVNDLSQMSQWEEEVESFYRFLNQHNSAVIKMDNDYRVTFANKQSRPLLEAWNGKLGHQLDPAIVMRLLSSSRTNTVIDKTNGYSFQIEVFEDIISSSTFITAKIVKD